MSGLMLHAQQVLLTATIRQPSSTLYISLSLHTHIHTHTYTHVYTHHYTPAHATCNLQAYTGASIGAAVQLNYGQADVCINWAGGLHHARKGRVRNLLLTHSSAGVSEQ